MNNPTPWELREQIVYLTGACAVVLMTVSMILSARIAFVSHWMNGLDKGYIVHKWTGILSSVFVLSHFLMENVPHWLVELNIIPNPGELTDGSQYAELEIDLYQSGMLLIQPAFYLMIALVVIALFKKIPYHWFRKSHKIFPVIFLIAAFHGATAQLKERWLGSPGSFILMFVLTIGVIAAVIALFRKIGASRKITAKISSIDLREGDILDLRLSTEGSAFDYWPGQYAFLKFAHDKEPHPFSMASFDNQRSSLRFAIKGLGDFTSALSERLSVGQTVEVEGPYGEFDFNDGCDRQVWIAGGIGITPFLSRLAYLAQHPERKPIDFWYSTRCARTEAFPQSLEQYCGQAGVNFYHLDSTKQEYLALASIRHRAGDLTNTSIWFCGPEAFSDCLIKELKESGFDLRNFHYDSFSMR